MYHLELDNGNKFNVRFRNHSINYATDGSLPNPLEATYAAIAGCAGVYARKACKALEISAEGIEINLKPVIQAGNNLTPKRLVTSVNFPDQITATQRSRILEEISHCAVKQLIQEGANIEFVTNEIA
jgi:uncharacterized OsmC-like protein